MPRLKPARRIPSAAPAAHGARQLGVRVVEDPFDPSNKISVPVNQRADFLRRAHARGEIDLAQLMAAERLRQAHEAVEACGLRAVDHGRVMVDGGRHGSSVSERALRAAGILREAQALLGWQGYRLVVAVAVEGLTGSLIAEQSTTAIDRKVAQGMVRGSLDQLAVMWGYASDPRYLRTQAAMVAHVTEKPAWAHEERRVEIQYGDSRVRDRA